MQFALFIFLRAAFNGILGDNEKVTLAFYPARALRALGLLLAGGAPTVGGGKTF